MEGKAGKKKARKTGQEPKERKSDTGRERRGHKEKKEERSEL